VLRELIRDILREELQGALGERITRNVRKLVRAEIARALAARDFD
jgi:negative regulator of sigma E activity